MKTASEHMGARLRERLRSNAIVLAPGVADGISALLAARAGAEAVYLSGASIAYTRLGAPDIGLVDMGEAAETLAVVAERSAAPVIADADTGFGNAVNVGRTVRSFERAGAAAIQLEDQTTPKRCGHLAGKALTSTSEMVGKLRAAQDARRFDDTLVCARTDAIAVEGFDAALRRADAYLNAGADILFVEAPRSAEEMATICGRYAGQAPVLANMVEGGKTPLMSTEELQALGYSIAIFPGGYVRAIAAAGADYYRSLLAHGSNAPFADRMTDLAGLNEILDTSEILKRAQAYDADAIGEAP